MCQSYSPSEDPRQKALEHFKDWSNYLLVTTVAAMGWVATQGDSFAIPCMKSWCLGLFGFSVVFGIFTLAMIPLLAEKLGKENSTTIASFYDATIEYTFGPNWKDFNIVEKTIVQRGYGPSKIKHVCWVQHVAFIAGIILYVLGNLGEPVIPACTVLEACQKILATP